MPTETISRVCIPTERRVEIINQLVKRFLRVHGLFNSSELPNDLG